MSITSEQTTVAQCRLGQTQLVQPKIGMQISICGVKCRIFKVWPAGTFDAEEIDGTRAWRITGVMGMQAIKTTLAA